MEGKKIRSDITPDPGVHRPQRTCAQGRACVKQDQPQASAPGQNQTQFGGGATTHGLRTRQAGKSVEPVAILPRSKCCCMFCCVWYMCTVPCTGLLPATVSKNHHYIACIRGNAHALVIFNRSFHAEIRQLRRALQLLTPGPDKQAERTSIARRRLGEG